MSDSKVTVNKVVGLEKGAFIDGAFDKAQFQSAYGICVLPNGNLVVVDRAAHRIRLVDFINKTVKTLAGCGEAGFGDGAGDKAKFNKPYAVVCDADGNLYVSDPENQRIRRIDAKTNAVTTAAGTGKMGFDDGASDKSTFYRPSGMALRDGNLYVADAINARIRCIDLKSNTVSTVIGTGRTGHKDSSLRESELNHPAGLAFEASGTLLIADQGNHRIRRADFKENKVTTVAGTGEQKTVDGEGLKACFQFPALILAASNGSVIIGEWGKGAALRVMDTKTGVTTVKGVKDYRGLSLNSQGQLFASTDTHIVRIDGLL